MKKIMSKKIWLDVKWSIFVILIYSVLLTGIMLLLQSNGVSDILLCVQNSPLMLLLNFLPILLFMLLFYFLTNRISISVGLSTIIFITMAIINRCVMQLRDMPFTPADLLLGGEVITIVLNFPLIFKILIAILIIVIIIFVVLLFIFIKNKKVSLPFRVTATMLTILAMFIANATLYTSATVNNKLFVEGNIYNQVNQFNSKGFLYEFIYTYNTQKVQKPANYSKQEIQDKEASYPQPDFASYDNTVKPNVILIMGEAYSDLGLAPCFNFDGYTDPYANFRKVSSEGTYGHIVVPNYGGGTADTEFDVLTGINTRDFRGVPYSFELINEPTYSLTDILENLGYQTEAIHPGYGWFYNRNNVYPNLGFQSFYELQSFLKDYGNDDMIAGYESDQVCFQKIMDDYDSHLASDSNTPFFEYSVTIQNHGPYPDKYGTDIPQDFDCSVPLSAQDTNALNNYFYGMKDFDAQLGTLVDHLQQSDQPTVLIFYGDHLPAISEDAFNSIFPSTDDQEVWNKIKMHFTPFVIWENDAAKGTTPGNDSTYDGQVFSSFYLGEKLLDYLGYTDVYPYFDFLDSLEAQYPIITEDQYVTSDGQLLTKQPGENTDIELDQRWEYYRLFDESPDGK